MSRDKATENVMVTYVKFYCNDCYLIIPKNYQRKHFTVQLTTSLLLKIDWFFIESEQKTSLFLVKEERQVSKSKRNYYGHC